MYAVLPVIVSYPTHKKSCEGWNHQIEMKIKVNPTIMSKSKNTIFLKVIFRYELQWKKHSVREPGL